MRNVLIATGFVVMFVTVVVIQAILVFNSNDLEITMTYWLGYSNVPIVVGSGTVIGFLHIILCIWASRKNKVEWFWAVPLAVIPFMMGVVVQGLLY